MLQRRDPRHRRSYLAEIITASYRERPHAAVSLGSCCTRFSVADGGITVEEPGGATGPKGFVTTVSHHASML